MGETTLHLFFRGRNYFGRHGGERARPLYTLNIYFFEVVITLGITEVRGPDHTQHLFFRGRNYFGRDGGERARPLNIYFFEVVIILGETEMRAVVRGPDHSTFIFSWS